MSIKSDKNLPIVYTGEQLAQRNRLATIWRLDESDLDQCDGHFLRNWTGLELQEQLRFEPEGSTLPVIKLWGISFIPVIEVKKELWNSLIYASLKGRDLYDAVNDKPVKFWLSFRHGKDLAGEEFAYVIIQEDLK